MRHLRPAPSEEANKCPLFSQSGTFKDRWPHTAFFSPPQWFFQLLLSATRTADCLGSNTSQLCCTEQLRKGKGEGCLQEEVTQESAFTILLTLGQGQTECTFQQKHQVATSCHPAKVHRGICGGKTTDF